MVRLDTESKEIFLGIMGVETLFNCTLLKVLAVHEPCHSQGAAITPYIPLARTACTQELCQSGAGPNLVPMNSPHMYVTLLNPHNSTSTSVSKQGHYEDLSFHTSSFLQVFQTNSNS